MVGITSKQVASILKLTTPLQIAGHIVRCYYKEVVSRSLLNNRLLYSFGTGPLLHAMSLLPCI